MSHAVCGAELAVTSDGELVLNVRALEGSTKLESLVRRASQQLGAIFVGVVLTRKEARNVVTEIGRILPNATRLGAAKRFWGREGEAAPSARERALSCTGGTEFSGEPPKGSGR
jgi:hypothetical protein